MASQQQQQQQQQMSGEGLSAHLAGMPKAQLYEIMSQMKVLIEQNQQQARQILIDNPLLTRALFQAQIMLGMVQPPQAMPIIQQTLSQPQPAHGVPQPNPQSTQSLPVQAGVSTSSQPPVPPRPAQTQTSTSLPPASVPPLSFQSQTMAVNMPLPPHQAKSFLSASVPSIPLPQSTPSQNLPPLPGPHYSMLQSHMPVTSGQTHQPVQTPGVLHQPLQPPLPQQPRPPSMQTFPHQVVHSQMPHNIGYQPSSAPQQLLAQPMFHPGSNLPSSFPQGQPPLPSQPPPQQLYQGGAHKGADYGNQVGNSAQTDRGAPWAPGLADKSITGAQLLGPSPLASGQIGPGISGQQPRPPPLTPEMEKALLQQVMSLTPEQINLLPPEQRSQVKQLQEMLMMR